MRDDPVILGRVRSVASKTFRCEPETIRLDTVAADVNNWDSLTHTHFLMEIEREFGIRFDLETVLGADTVGDLVRQIEELLR